MCRAVWSLAVLGSAVCLATPFVACVPRVAAQAAPRPLPPPAIAPPPPSRTQPSASDAYLPAPARVVPDDQLHTDAASNPYYVAPPILPPSAAPTAATPGARTPDQPGAAHGDHGDHGDHADDHADHDDDTLSVSPQPQSFEGDAWGDEPSTMIAGMMSFRMLLQVRYEDTLAAASTNARPGYAVREDVLMHEDDGFQLERFYFRVAADPKPWLGFKALLDLSRLRGSNVSNVLKQANATLRVVPRRLELIAGVFKIPFSILELDPQARYELSELGHTDNIIENMGFAGRDVGVELMFAPLPKPKWLRLIAGAFRGRSYDEHASPFGTLGARLESKPFKGFRLGVDGSWMPFDSVYKRPFETSNRQVLPMPPDPMYPREQRWAKGSAYSADLSYSRKRFTLRVEGMLGDRVDVDRRYGARSFAAAWALLAFRFKVGAVGVMPAARVEWLDLDRDHDNGERLGLTLGLNLLYKKNVRFIIDVTRTEVQANTPYVEQPELAVFPYLDRDNTRVVAQLQLEI
ncbi:MAG: hypothetical protein ABW321_12850 [Polyangiales bacterium]